MINKPDFKNPWTLIMLAVILVLLITLAWSPVANWINPPIAFTDDAGKFLFARQIPGTNKVLALGFQEGGAVRWNRFTAQGNKVVPAKVAESRDSLESAIKDAQEFLEEDINKAIDEAAIAADSATGL